MSPVWSRNRKRKRLLAQPLPAGWLDLIRHAVQWFGGWSTEVRDRFVDNVRIFVAEKNWEGCRGQPINEEVQVVIAAQAALMLTGIRNYCFEGVQTILVYPASFRGETREGMLVGETERIGEAWHRGPIILSWADVAESPPGRNVVVHELAHHLDGLDGDIGGVPESGNPETDQQRSQVMAGELDRLVQQLERGMPTLLDPYAASNPAEFFAVACEVFFELPGPLQTQHRSLYDCLAAFFHADPARWQPGRPGPY